jgi:hypothetical protein
MDHRCSLYLCESDFYPWQKFSSLPSLISCNFLSRREDFPLDIASHCRDRIDPHAINLRRSDMGRRFGRLRRSPDGSGRYSATTQPEAQHTISSSLSSKVLIDKTPEASTHPSNSPQPSRTPTGEPAALAAHRARSDSSKRPSFGANAATDKNLPDLPGLILWLRSKAALRFFAASRCS